MDWYQGPRAPVVLGHEPVGVVVATGPAAGTPLPAPGPRVFVHHHVPCEACEYCRRGLETLCDVFKATRIEPGGFSELILVPARNAALDLLAVPDEVSRRSGDGDRAARVRRARRCGGARRRRPHAPARGRRRADGAADRAGGASRRARRWRSPSRWASAGSSRASSARWRSRPSATPSARRSAPRRPWRSCAPSAAAAWELALETRRPRRRDPVLRARRPRRAARLRAARPLLPGARDPVQLLRGPARHARGARADRRRARWPAERLVTHRFPLERTADALARRAGARASR